MSTLTQSINKDVEVEEREAILRLKCKNNC